MTVENSIIEKPKFRVEILLEGELAKAFIAFRDKEKLQKNAPTAFKLVADGLEREGFYQHTAQQESATNHSIAAG